MNQRTASIYARSAVDLQDGNNIDNQRAACETYANREGFKITGIFSDCGKSGASMHNRDGLMDLRNAAKRCEFDAVIVESFDRLSRNIEDIAELFLYLNQCGIKVLTAKDGNQ